MVHLIDKDTLVAEIEKLMYAANLEADIASTGECFDEKIADAKYQLCNYILCVINTLEVKEVDLEKEIMKYQREIYDRDTTVRDVAKHFFKLGLSVSNSTKVTTPDIDDVLKENGVNPDSKEAKIIKESYFMAIEKLTQKGK